MDGDIGAMLQSVLSDPEQMAKLTSAAQSLLGGEGAAAPAVPPKPPEEHPSASQPEGLEKNLLSALARSLAAPRENKSRSAALLQAMRPYMRAEKQEKLDRAMQVTRMVHIAGTVMRELGGGKNGL